MPSANREYEQLRKGVGVFPDAIERAGTRARLLYSCAGDFTDKNSPAIVAFATLVVGIFTFTLWRSTNRLWHASLEHAGHAQRAIQASERSAERQLRAYVFAISPTIADWRDQTLSTYKPLMARMIIKNTGKTPVYDYQVFGGMCIIKYNRDSNTAVSVTPLDYSDQGVGKGMLGLVRKEKKVNRSMPMIQTTTDMGARQQRTRLVVWK